MSERVTMPALGESVTEGTVTRWLKNVGDQVEVDEPLLEVSTDKVDTEIPSPVAGTLQEVLVQEDETVEVGADLAVVGDGAPEGGEDSGGSEESEESDESEQDTQQDTEESQGSDEQEDGGSASAPSDTEEPAKKPTAGTESSGEGQKVEMPALGESVTEGTVTRWLKSEGDEVEVDEPLLEVSTDKVDTEIPSPVAGTLTKILVQEDETVEVGADLAIVGGAPSGGDGGGAEEEQAEEPESQGEQDEEPESQGEQAEQEQTEQEQAAQEKSEEPEEPRREQPAPAQKDTGTESEKATAPAARATSGGDASSYVTPLVRRLAADHGVDLAAVTGTGVGGRIRKQDVLDAAEAARQPEPEQAPAAPASQSAAASTAPASTASSVSPSKRGTREKMSRLRKVIAQRMVESLQVSAQLTTVVEVDMTKVMRTRSRAKDEFARREGTKLSVLPFIALATVEALKVHPSLNASIEGEEIVYHGQENLSVAVDTEKGLIVPVVKNAGDLNIAGLARGIADVAERTRSNSIGPDDLAGGTFTITNTGSRGALFDTPILNQPQVGMLGTGSIVKRPVVVADADGGESIAIRSMMYLALSYDHRIVDGADAARFLATVKDRLEEGEFEAELGL